MNNTWVRLTWIAVLAASLVLAVGCGRRRGAVVVTGGMTPDQHEQLIALASRETGCAPQVLAPQLVSTQPNVFTVTGCATPVEYWQRCSRRRCSWERVAFLAEVAAGTLQCAPQMIQHQPTEAPNARIALGCGRMASFALGCDGRSCAWTVTSGVSAMGATGSDPAYAQQQQQVVSPQITVQSHGIAPSNLEAEVHTQREAVLSCVDPGVQLTLSLRWTSEGQVMLQLPQDLAGTAAEGCIQAALGALRVAAQGPGEMTVPLR